MGSSGIFAIPFPQKIPRSNISSFINLGNARNRPIFDRMLHSYQLFAPQSHSSSMANKIQHTPSLSWHSMHKYSATNKFLGNAPQDLSESHRNSLTKRFEISN